VDIKGNPAIPGLGKNEVRAIRSIFFQDKPTRRTIARDSRLSLVKISAILNDLEDRGVVLKEGKTRTSGGRPSHLYRIRGDVGFTLGLNVRLDKIRIVAMDGAKHLLFRRTRPLALLPQPSSHGEAIVNQLCTIVDEALASVPHPDRMLAIGLALPGMVDTQRGVWLLGLQLTGITHIEIAELLTGRYGVPVIVEDVARSLAFREMYLGEGRSFRDFVLLYLGLGMGSGLVLDRRLYRGFHGLAGEIGHIEHPQNNYRCTCGNVGCLETVVSPSGILRVFRDRLQEGVRSQLQTHSSPGAAPLTLERVLGAAQAGDRLALSTLAEIGGFLGDAAAMLIKLFNPQALIVSGDVTLFAEYLREPVERVVIGRVLPEMLVDYRTIFSDYQPEHEAHGAALLAVSHLFERLVRGAAESGETLP
jgi:predicted NBD/HSP70 family sugar kinase